MGEACFWGHHSDRAVEVMVVLLFVEGKDSRSGRKGKYDRDEERIRNTG